MTRGTTAPERTRHNAVMSQTTEAPVEVRRPESDEVHEDDRPWIVLVWNDPINLMSYVAFVFRKLFGYSEAEATKLMLQVHEEGKAVVASGTREKSEHDVCAPPRPRALGHVAPGLTRAPADRERRSGGYRLRLRAEERAVLRGLAGAAPRPPRDGRPEPHAPLSARLRGSRGRTTSTACSSAGSCSTASSPRFASSKRPSMPSTSTRRSCRRGSVRSRACASCSAHSSA